MKKHFGFGLSIPSSDTNLVQELSAWLTMAGSQTKCLLVLDALNQLDDGSGTEGWLNNKCSSSSSSCEFHFYIGSMWDDLRPHVARSHTSSPDCAFSPILSLTRFQPSSPSPKPSSHPIPFHFHRPLYSYAVLISLHHMPVPLKSPFLDLL